MDEFEVRPTELPVENDFSWPDQSLGYLSPIAHIEKGNCRNMLPGVAHVAS